MYWLYWILCHFPTYPPRTDISKFHHHTIIWQCGEKSGNKMGQHHGVYDVKRQQALVYFSHVMKLQVILCTCNTLKPFSQNDSKFISIQPLHGYADAIQVSHTRWSPWWEDTFNKDCTQAPTDTMDLVER